MKNLIIAIMILVQAGCNKVATNQVTVDKIEENNIAAVEVVHNNETKMIDIPQEDFNTPKSEGERISFSTASGTFGNGLYNEFDGKVYYQFKSFDNKVWWCLTAEEIGFIPTSNKSYNLMYYDNGTTDCLECDTKYDCECEVYDDIFLSVVTE